MECAPHIPRTTNENWKFNAFYSVVFISAQTLLVFGCSKNHKKSISLLRFGYTNTDTQLWKWWRATPSVREMKCVSVYIYMDWAWVIKPSTCYVNQLSAYWFFFRSSPPSHKCFRCVSGKRIWLMAVTAAVAAGMVMATAKQMYGRT